MFFDPPTFACLQPLQQNWQAIRAEYDAVASTAFVSPESIHNGGWTVIGMRFQDQDLPGRFSTPLTRRLCEAIPGCHTYGFSIMRPGCVITPHIGHTDQVLRVHLGLYSNPHCGIRVGQEVRSWQPGELLVFDDMVEHETWNRGRWSRAILLVDVYKSALGLPSP